MIVRVIAWSARHARIVLALALALALCGVVALRTLDRDVLPDLSDPQVVLVADWTGHPAMEVAAAITSPLTAALGGLPGAVAIRGSSMSGMAYVDVIFDSPAAMDAGRAEIVRRTDELRPHLPAGVRLQVGPHASSVGWVYQYALIDPTHGESRVTLLRYQQEVLRPALAAIPGVAEVASFGGSPETVQVDVDSAQLRRQGLAFSEVADAVRGAFAGGRTVGFRQIATLQVNDTSKVRDVARVRADRDMSSGMADLDGTTLAAVGGIVVADRDAPVTKVLKEIQGVVEAQRAKLPGGLKLVTVYDRSEVIDRIQQTLSRALMEEVAVVALVILLFLLHPASALVPLITLPLVVLLTFLAMRLLGLPATLMSLGGIGIALGIAVDAEVVALEACHRHLEGSPSDRSAALVNAATLFGPAIVVALLITALSFMPVLAFGGETGRLLRPLAITKTLVMGAAALVSLTVGPALRERLLRSGVLAEFSHPLTRNLVRLYRPFVQFALARPALTLAVALLALLSCVPVALGLGGEFLPRVDEGDLLYMPTTLPGARPDELLTQLALQDRALSAAPEVATVFGKVGRSDSATDPAPMEMAETTIRLRPREGWPVELHPRWYSSWAPSPLRFVLGFFWPELRPATTAELIERLDRAARLPGWIPAWTAPARARLDMMSTGVRTPVGARIVAADPARLAELGEAVQRVLGRVEGTRSSAFESQGGATRLHFVPDPAALARYQVDPAELEATASLLETDGTVGLLDTDGRVLRVRVGQDLNARAPADALRDLTVRPRPGGPPIPLALLGRPVYRTEPAGVRTESGETVAYVHVDLEAGVDLQYYVERARSEVDRARASGELKPGPGERIEWIGQYPLLLAGMRRLAFIVPLALLAMLGLLYLLFRSLTESLIVLASVPFALVGSFWTLRLAGYPMSAPVWVGLLSVAGLAMQTAVVMVVYIDDAFFRRLSRGELRTREDIVEAHTEGTVRRLRPKLMTVGTMAAGLLPFLWAEGAGAEIMRRVAAPMIGGLATSAFLTLEVLPVLYTLWRGRQLRAAHEHGIPLEQVCGTKPSWLRN